jgi:ketosteroid isomerase-like protein
MGVSSTLRVGRVVPAFVMALLAATAACSRPTPSVPLAERVEAARRIKREVIAAYDFSKPNVVENLMSLYAPDTRIISASAGRTITSRDSLQMGIAAFWANVGRNMRDPRVEWTRMDIDVLSPTVAVMTATYRIPHKQPNGLPHVVGGTWSAVFEKRGNQWLIVNEHLSDDPLAH